MTNSCNSSCVILSSVFCFSINSDYCCCTPTDHPSHIDRSTEPTQSTGPDSRRAGNAVSRPASSPCACFVGPPTIDSAAVAAIYTNKLSGYQTVSPSDGVGRCAGHATTCRRPNQSARTAIGRPEARTKVGRGRRRWRRGMYGDIRWVACGRGGSIS